MSASDKKKLRHEQLATQMTERQQEEAKEAKKLHLYTVIFTVVIALMICVVIFVSVFNSGIIQRNTTAATVGSTEISAPEFNYYYVDSINGFMNQFGSYLSLTGLDPSKPLDEQVQDEESGDTWADYFMDMAADSMKNAYAIYNESVAQNYVPTEEVQLMLDARLESITAQFPQTDLKGYLTAVYGKGANEETYRHYMQVQMIAGEFASAHNDSLVFEDADIRAHEAENFNAYTSYSYNTYFLSAPKFYQGGSVDEEGKVSYTDEQKEAGLAACEEAAQSLVDAKPATVEELDKAIAALDVNKGSDTPAASSPVDDNLYGSINELIRGWITDESRKEGDITMIANKTETANEDGTTTEVINGYYVLFFRGSNDNTFPLANVRHILLNHEGGTPDANGNLLFTPEEKEATRAKAEELLNQFTGGEATEDAFAALAKENSTDPGSKENGGLYENVYPGQMVTDFDHWCFEDGRKAGDTGIVDSTYGVHIIYYVGDADITYRDYMITTDLRNLAMNEWQTGLAEKTEVQIQNTSNVKTDVVLGGN